MDIKPDTMIRSSVFLVLSNIIGIFLLLGFAALSLSCFDSGDGDNNDGSSDTQYSVGGSVTDLQGSGLVLQNNDGDDLPIYNDGPFEFSTLLADGDAYKVTVKDHPASPLQACVVTDGTGTINGLDVSGVNVSCMATTTGGNCNSGTIVYDHNSTSSYLGFSQQITVSGSVPFTCDDSNNISGSGSLTISVNGNLVAGCDVCNWSGSASMNVTLSGALVASIVSIQFNEVWYVGSPSASGTCEDTCTVPPDISPYSYPLLEVPITHTVQFPDINGYSIVSPASGVATSGNYSWTLYIQ